MTEVAQPDEASARLKFHIKTFTGRYIPVEDRLRLDAVDEECNKQSLFMTRRLVDRIIPVMVEHLEGQSPEGMPSDLVQEMQQDRARQVHAEGPRRPRFMSSPSSFLGCAARFTSRRLGRASSSCLRMTCILRPKCQ